MSFEEFKYLVKSDLYRLNGYVTVGLLLRNVFFGREFQYNFWLRACGFSRTYKFLKYTVYPLAVIQHRRLGYKYGISVSPATVIGPGFFIGHYGGIVVNTDALIGSNCNISQGVTIGQSNRGKNKGVPTIGDNCYIGPGAKIVGGVTIGKNVAIGANCVVTKDIADSSVVVGIPGRVISQQGSTDYVNHTDY